MKTLSLAGFETKTLVTHSCFLLCVLQWWAALHLQETCKVESDMLQVLTISNKKCKYWIWWKRLCFLFFFSTVIFISSRVGVVSRTSDQTQAAVQRWAESEKRGCINSSSSRRSSFVVLAQQTQSLYCLLSEYHRLNLIYPHGVKDSKSLCQLNSELMWRLRALQFCRQWKY